MDMNENQMIFNDDEEFSMTDDQYLNPKYMFKLHWIAEPRKLKLEKPNIETYNIGKYDIMQPEFEKE